MTESDESRHVGDLDRPITVLHVDDEPGLPETVAANLEQRDERFEVLTGEGPDEGVRLLDEHDVDCVVSDYDMPTADGLAFLDDVRNLDPDLPFILFTGKGSEEVASDAISAGVTDYIRKGSGEDRYAVLANRIGQAVEASRARRAVQRSERRLRRTYERITDGLFTVDTDWRYTYANEAGAEFVGKEPEELIGERVWDVFPELRDTSFGDALERAMETKEFAHVEDRYGPLDTWYDVRVYPDEDGISIFFQEISERKEQEQEVQRERDRYATLFEDAATPIMAFRFDDGDPVVTDVNRAFEEVFDYREDEVVGETVAATIVPDGARAGHESIADRVMAGERVEEEVQRRTADGVRDFVLRVIPVDLADAPTDGYAWLTDVTERKERERELAETNTLLAGILDTTPAAVFVKDLDGRYRLMNERCRSLFGIDEDAVEGLTDDDLFPSDVADRFRRDDRRVIEEGVTVETEEEVPTDDGDRTFLTLKSPLTDADGEPTGLCSVAIDITERVAYERAVAEKDERLDEFASVVSHDLRNPLQVLAGSLDIAEETGDTEQFERAHQAVDRMDALIEDLLALAEEGRRVGERGPVALDELAERCWTTVETGDASLDVATDLVVEADEGRLAELLENLFNNAVRHGGPDVTVTVGALADGDGFYVADDGPGIPEESRDAVFDSGYTTADDGTGLGLAIVRDIAAAHGWRVALADGHEGGARFEVRGVDAV